MENNLITIIDMAKLLKISRSKAYSLSKEKGFPIIKIGRLIRVNKEKLFKWLST